MSLQCRMSIYCQSPVIAVGIDVVYTIFRSARAALVVAVVRTAAIRCERQAKTSRPRHVVNQVKDHDAVNHFLRRKAACVQSRRRCCLAGASQSRVRATMATPCRTVSPSFRCGPRENTCQSSSGHRVRRCWPCVTQKQPDLHASHSHTNNVHTFLLHTALKDIP
jgi:hypothetical protein